jgi:hypothetical protein
LRNGEQRGAEAAGLRRRGAPAADPLDPAEARRASRRAAQWAARREHEWAAQATCCKYCCVTTAVVPAPSSREATPRVIEAPRKRDATDPALGKTQPARGRGAGPHMVALGFSPTFARLAEVSGPAWPPSARSHAASAPLYWASAAPELKWVFLGALPGRPRPGAPPYLGPAPDAVSPPHAVLRP